MKEKFEIVDRDETIASEPCRCIDGRSLSPRFGVPGGSFAVLFTVLNEANKTWKQSEIMEVMKGVSQNLFPIYLHSDNHKLEHFLEKGVGGIAEALDRDFDAYIASFLSNQGCGHLNIIFNESEAEVQNLLKNMMTCFWKLYQKGDSRVIFESLPGSHEEIDILLIEDQEPKLLRYVGDEQQHFVYHATVEVDIAEKVNSWLVEAKYVEASIDMDSVKGSLQKQAGRTVEVLAPSLDMVTIK